MRKKHVWVDIDDTILANHHLYQEAKAKAAIELMKIDRYLNNVSEIATIIEATSNKNIATMGLSMKRFPKSVLEGVLAYAAQNSRVIPEQYHQRFIEIGEEVFSPTNYVNLLPGAKGVLEKLSKDYTLMFVTEGDLIAQQRKVDALSLNRYGPTHIVARKSAGVLKDLAIAQDVNPQNIVFIGNSLRSDIIPSSQIGCATVYIPFESWNGHHPPGDVVAPVGPRHLTLDTIAQVHYYYDEISSSVK